MGTPSLVYCADGNPQFARIAIELGWLYGARLPSTVYQPVWFADQDWKKPDRKGYMEALALHRPNRATVIDWEREAQFDEVFQWMEDAAVHVQEAVIVIPKVARTIAKIPKTVNGKRVILGYSVPTTYGGTMVPIHEFSGREIHLLGGSPHKQMSLRKKLSMLGSVVSSVDGNMAAQQARKGRVWCGRREKRGHWVQLRDLGDNRTEDIPVTCFPISLINIRAAWEGRGVVDTTVRFF